MLLFLQRISIDGGKGLAIFTLFNFHLDPIGFKVVVNGKKKVKWMTE